MMKRRQFLLGSLGVVGGLGIGWTLLPPRQRLTPSTPLPVQPGQVALNGWVKISADNVVTVMASQVEMGQGTHTGLAMLLAEELDAAWEQVRIEQAPIDGIFSNQALAAEGLPFHPDDHGLLKRGLGRLGAKVVREVPAMIVTGGSSSIKDQWLPMREAGASARAMLIAAAASTWRVPEQECHAEAGRVVHVSGKSASFGELAARAAQVSLPKHVVLKDPAAFKLIGKPVRRLDAAAKIDGSARFSLDALPDGLVYAAVKMCPTLGGTVAYADGSEALPLPGVRQVVVLDPYAGGIGTTGTGTGGVAVIAETPHQALRAVERVRVEWNHGAAATVSSRETIDQLARLLDTQKGRTYYAHGDVDAVASGDVATVVSAEYRVPYLAHAAMEPLNCTVHFTGGAATVWAATQMPGFARQAVATVLGIGVDRVQLHIPYLGGAFGRRGPTDFIAQAAAVARAAGGVPVQTFWTREQDMTHDFYRPAFVSRGRAKLGPQGQLLAWEMSSAGSGMGTPAFLDKSADGVSDTAYAFPAARVTHILQDSPIPVGFWRSVGHSQGAFFTESFIDEVAAASGTDPVAFRAALLKDNPKHLRVLTRVAELAGWGTPLAPAADGAKKARGLALHRSFGTVVAQVADVSIGPNRQIRVHRVVCVVDCGFALNPNLVRQQMEGGIVFGLSAALFGAITVDKGQVQQTNFHDYMPLRIDACPAIEVDIIPSGEPPEGVGEPGTPPIAPAVANAVFALTGQRLRSLPFTLAAT